jgi:hypothetical protein
VIEDEGQRDRIEGIGCAWTLLGVNAVVMGVVAAAFARGPYSSGQQELWYRYGSLGFVLAGVVLPAVTLYVARRSDGVGVACTAWMLAALFAFLGFVMMSGGGV